MHQDVNLTPHNPTARTPEQQGNEAQQQTLVSQLEPQPRLLEPLPPAHLELHPMSAKAGAPAAHACVSRGTERHRPKGALRGSSGGCACALGVADALGVAVTNLGAALRGSSGGCACALCVVAALDPCNLEIGSKLGFILKSNFKQNQTIVFVDLFLPYPWGPARALPMGHWISKTAMTSLAQTTC